MSDYDVIVLGVGSAGSKAAATAAKEGAKVLAVESGELGGLCILRGCMPTKTLLETAHRLHEIRDAERFGITVAAPEVNFSVQMERMRQLVARFKRAKVGGIERGGYELRRAPSTFTGPNTVDVGGESLSAKAFVIATGSVVRPFGFDVPAGTRLCDSDDMFTLESAPARATVCGGGAVGLEFAQWLARMGTAVTLVVRSPLLHRQDPEMGQELIRALSEEMTVLCPAAIQGLEDGHMRVKLGDGSETRFEMGELLLNATGRIPNVADLDLPAAGLDPRDLGLGDRFQTKVPHIFCAGDATGDKAILHEANLEGEVAGRNAARIASGSDDLVSYDGDTPELSVIFSDPPVAFAGLTPQDCEAKGIPFEAATKHFPQQGRGIVVGAEFGFMRLLAEPGAGRVLGCQIMGPRADDLIHIPATVMRLGGTVAQMRKVPWYHPTLAEAFVEVTRELVGS